MYNNFDIGNYVMLFCAIVCKLKAYRVCKDNKRQGFVILPLSQNRNVVTCHWFIFRRSKMSDLDNFKWRRYRMKYIEERTIPLIESETK